MGLSTSKADACQEWTVLGFREGVLESIQDLGKDREKWVEVLKAHAADFGVDANRGIVEWRTVKGAPTSAALITFGIPHRGPDRGTNLRREPSTIEAVDTLYYVTDRLSGRAVVIGIDGGKVVSSEFGQRLYTHLRARM